MVEVQGGNAVADADKFKAAVADKLGDQAGEVVRLGRYPMAEVLDIDPTASEEDVLAAIKRPVSNDKDPAMALDAESIKIMGLWPVKGGTEIATARLPEGALARLLGLGRWRLDGRWRG